MRLPKNLGFILLAIWLVIRGLVALISLSFAGLDIILAVLAVAAGILILFGLRGKRLARPRNLGLLLLGIWLILPAVLQLLGESPGWTDLLLASLAVAAGALLLFDILRASPLGDLGVLLLAVWLLLTGLVALVGLSFSGLSIVLGLLALLGGILLLVGR